MQNRPLSILVAEDDQITRQRLLLFLHEAGHTVTAVDDGLKAFESVSMHKPDVILSDWDMPQMDGLELCERLRENPMTRAIYFILLTGDLEGSERERKIHESTIDELILKPWEPRVLSVRLQSLQRQLSD
jgi:CheY-like chemotaxis protein